MINYGIINTFTPNQPFKITRKNNKLTLIDHFTRPAILLLSVLLLKCEANSFGSPQNIQKQCVAMEATSFMELVDQNHAFVDKTLFIKDFLETNGPKVMRVSYPPKWGKTMNMKMIEDFLQLEVDESGYKVDPEQTAAYRLFALGKTASGLDVRLNIAIYRHIIDKYAAQHPVIYVSFKNVTGSTSEEIFKAMKLAVADTFKKHAYMTKVFQNTLKFGSTNDEVQKKVKDNLEKFQAILSSTASDVLESVSFLANILQEHFEKKVYVLIDDHDQPLLTFLQQKARNLKKIKQTEKDLTYLIDFSYSFRCNEHCERSLINGAVRVAPTQVDSNHSNLNDFAEFSMLENKFADYYGFNEDEVSLLFARCGIDAQLADDAKKWYKGYTTNKARYVDVYNPYDVLKFAYHGKISNYWVRSGAVPLAPCIFRDKFVESFVLSLLNKEPAVIESDNLGCSVNQLDELATALNPPSSPLSSLLPVGSKATEYLLMTGYLTLNKSTENPSMAHVRVPNEEIATEMASLLAQYYRETYSIPHSAQNQLEEELKQLPKTNDSVAFKRSLEAVFSSFPEFTAKNSNDPLKENQDVVNSAFNMLTLLTKGIYHSNSEIHLVKNREKGSVNREARPNIVLDFKEINFVIIIQLAFNSASEKALSLAEKYLQVFDSNQNAKFVGLIGVNVFPNKTVDLKEFWGRKKKK